MISGGRPDSADVLKEMIPLARHWKTIGTLLHVPNLVLDRIKSDEGGICDQLREMLSEWLKRTSPSPTWAALADAVEPIDPSKANELRKRCLDIPV